MVIVAEVMSIEVVGVKQVRWKPCSTVWKRVWIFIKKCRSHTLRSLEEDIGQFLKGIYGYMDMCFFFFFGCVVSSLLHVGFLQLQRAGTTLRCGAQASHCGGFSCCGAWALGARASVVVACRLQQLWHTGLVAPRHEGSSWTRARTHVPCMGRRILNHCATRVVLDMRFLLFIFRN